MIGIAQLKSHLRREVPDISQSNMFADRTILLNPGPNYKIDANDLCLYIALIKEENFNFKEAKKVCKYILPRREAKFVNVNIFFSSCC